MSQSLCSVSALLSGVAIGLAFTAGAHAQPATNLHGLWATRGFGSIVRLYPCAEDVQAVCGRIVWLWEAGDEGGRARTDRHNPDRALRGRPLVGMEILRGLRATGPGAWGGGALYNPDDGRTYAGTIRQRGEALELRGCALSIVCQSQTWRRPQDILSVIERLTP